MERTVTVKGVGRAVAKPDFIVISMALDSLDMDYGRAVDTAGEKIEALREGLFAVGFERDCLKTTDFAVDTEYESKRDSDGSYNSIFRGYRVRHSLKLSFDLEKKMLSQAIFAIAGSSSKPKFSISFTVKDASRINEELLRTAATNARKKAQILADASGVKLGEIVNIIYDWMEIDAFSRTRYDITGAPTQKCEKAIDFEPDDIDVSDSATFVWSIG